MQSRFMLMVGWFASGMAGAVVLDEVARVEGDYLKFAIAPNGGGAIEELTLLSSGHNFSGRDGLLQEGFGVGSPYVPNRRINEKLEALEEIADRPVLRYSYDCDGPQVRGLHVTRTLELNRGQSCLRVHWAIEHKGTEELWLSPWVANDVLPGGNFDSSDRIDVPTLGGVAQAKQGGYFPASRNWIATTDPAAKESIFAVFNADLTHSFLAIRDTEDKTCSFQVALVPRPMKPGEKWETAYRIGLVRGLSHVDFASDELAVQLDYQPGVLEVRIAATKHLPSMELESSVRTAGGEVWRLPGQRFAMEPNKVVLCRYDWTAPADGVYEFLAQLKSDGKVYPIGKETASPHGGIDTQFIVGKPGRATMEAWTDAPYALQRRPRKLRRALATSGDTAIWFESSLEKVFQEDVPEPVGTVQSTYHLSLARNESESFQIVLRPPEGKDLAGITVQARDFVHTQSAARIPPANIVISRVAYHPVTVPSYFEGPTGSWPDALPPFQPFTATGGQNYPVWITVSCPRKVPSGTYTGMVEISAAGLEPVELRIEASVFDFDLPVTPALKTDFGFWTDEAVRSCQVGGFRGTRAQLLNAYLDNALRHRVTLRELTAFPSESADYAATLGDFEPRLVDSLKRGVTTVSVPPSLLEVPEQLKQAGAFIAEHQLEKRVFCQFADEPPPPTWERLKEGMQHWKDAAPHVPLMLTASGLQPLLLDPVDIWAVHLQMFDTVNNRPVMSRIAQGGEVWCYVNRMPSRPYGNFFIDYAGIEHRVLFWQAWALGIRGFHYWGVNYAEEGPDPWENLLDITPVNGDGFLVYPSAEGPVNSQRWEIIRDGIEDYDYLVLLRAGIRRLAKSGGQEALLKRAQAAGNLEQIVPDLVQFSRDPQTLSAKRDQIGKMIEELNHAAPPVAPDS
ncbi:MAG: DUF4091 domain-containing protein [Candidatus Hydrogenedentes bacterium]|nr:DUF4091 domain-containing protein [Candidatus Hydrogenedentota bacterium]